MLPRVLKPDENVRVEPVPWPALTAAPTAPANAEELREARSGLAAALDELRVARERVAALESAFAGAEAAAYRKGLEEGAQTARLEAEAQQQALLDRISRAISEVAGLRGRIRREAESDLVKLSLAIARRITHREMSVDPEALAGVVRSALARIPAGELTKVRLHPSTVKTVRFQLEQLKVPATVEIEADASLEPGDLYLETAGDMLDASIDTQLREIERGFCDRLQS